MILVTGATGFVGSRLSGRLAGEGRTVRSLVRRNSPVGRLPSGVETVTGDVGDPASLERAAEGCEAVIHLVGIIQPGPGYTFQSVHVEGTRNVLEAAKKAGTVRHFIYQSALGTRPGAASEYHRTKLAAEEMTKASGLNYSIARPSVIFGPGDGFTAKYVRIIRSAPVVPVAGDGRPRLQPVHIDDLTGAISRILLNPDYFGRTVELGGPERLTLDEMVAAVKAALGSRKPVLHIPMPLMKTMARLMEKVMERPPVTVDQLLMLVEDNVCGTEGLERLGIRPASFRDGLGRFLRPYSKM